MNKINKVNNFKLIFKQLFEIKSMKNPWGKAIGAGLAVAIPMFISYILGDISLGLLSSLGSFTYLYLANEPYAFRFKKLLFSAIGISISVALGTLVAPYRILIAIVVALIGLISMYIFGVVKTKGPTGMFFILTFLMATGMPEDPSLFLNRGFFVLLAGILSLIISMVGYLFKPHGPEINALKGLFLQLSKFSKLTDEKEIFKEKHKTIDALLNVEETIVIGYMPWEKYSSSNKFSALNEEVNKLYIEINKAQNLKNKNLPNEVSDILIRFSNSIENKEAVYFEVNSEFKEIYNILKNINNIIINTLDNISYEIKINKPSLKSRMLEDFNKDSLVFANALRYGIVLFISAFIAFYFGFERAYWIPLSCASVMSGSTIIATFNRGIQRTMGTMIGVIVVSIILSLKPSILMIIILNVLLTAITEMLIIRNYAIAVIFITQNAIILAETSTNINDISYFVTARIINVIIGSLIGLIGTYLINKKSASSRLPNLINKLLNSQTDFILKLIENKDNKLNNKIMNDLREKMVINFSNFKAAYITALGEINKDGNYVDNLWPIFISLENINYIIDYYYLKGDFIDISEDKLNDLLITCERLNEKLRLNEFLKSKDLNNISEINNLYGKINFLENNLKQLIY